MGNLEEKDAKRLKNVSKVIEVLAKIAKVLMIIAIPFIVIGMVAVLIVMKKFDYQENTVFFDNKPIATFKEDINGISISYNEDDEEKSIYVDITKDFADAVSIISFKKFLDNNSFNKIVLYFELAMLFAIAIIVVSILSLRHTEKFFQNIRIKDTPFIEENTLHLKSIAMLLTINTGISLMVNIVLSIIINTDLNYTISGISIMEIFVTVCAYYIFKYGCNLQAKSKMKIYEEGQA